MDQPKRITPERMAALVAHYQRLQGLGRWRFTVAVVPGLQHEGQDAWATVDPAMTPDGRLAVDEDGCFSARVRVRDIDATPIPGFDGDALYELRVTIAHELAHCWVAEFMDAGQSIEAEERLVEAAAQAIVRSETSGDARVMARAVSGMPSRLRARISARAPLARGGSMDPEKIKALIAAIKEQDGEAALQIAEAMLVEAASGTPQPADAAPPSESMEAKVQPPEGGGDGMSAKVEPPAGGGAAPVKPAADSSYGREARARIDAEHARARKATDSLVGSAIRARIYEERRGGFQLTPALEQSLLKMTDLERFEERVEDLKAGAALGKPPTRARDAVAPVGGHSATPPPADEVAPPVSDEQLRAEGADETFITMYKTVAASDPKSAEGLLKGFRDPVTAAGRARLAGKGPTARALAGQGRPS